MAATDSKRYFWFKCDHEFFNGTKMKRLGKSKAFDFDGLTDEEKRQVCALAMQAIYIRLLAESCTHDGELLYDAENPYDDDGVSEVLDCPTSVYRVTKDRLIDLKLMSCRESGQLNFLELANFIGSETGIARRMRLWRNGDQVTDGSQDGDGQVTSGLQCNRPGLQAGYIVTDQGHKSVAMYPRDKRLEIRDKNNKQGDITSLAPLPPAGGCGSENGQVVRQYPMEKILTACMQAHLYASREDAERFGRYVYDNCLLESEDRRVGSIVGLVKSIHNRWKSEGLDREDLHRLTVDELSCVCAEVNRDIRGEQIQSTDRDVFWNWLVGIDFKTTKGDLVTAYNVRKLLSWWLENKYNLKEEHEKAAKNYREPVKDWKPRPVDPNLPPWLELD